MICLKMAASFLSADFFSFPDGYDRMVSLNELTFGIQADIKNRSSDSSIMFIRSTVPK